VAVDTVIVASDS